MWSKTKNAMCHWFSFHISASSVIHYCTDQRLLSLQYLRLQTNCRLIRGDNVSTFGRAASHLEETGFKITINREILCENNASYLHRHNRPPFAWWQFECFLLSKRTMFSPSWKQMGMSDRNGVHSKASLFSYSWNAFISQITKTILIRFNCLSRQTKVTEEMIHPTQVWVSHHTHLKANV